MVITEKDEVLPEKKHRPPTKVIMRRLPPTITDNELLEQISPLPSYDYFKFVPADYSLNPWAYSRAYFNLTNPDDVVLFRDRFNGYVFIDAKGNEFPAMVEYSPSQKVPLKKTKKDIKCGMIDEDPEYKEFLEQLKNPPVPVRTIDSTIAEIEKREKELKEGHGCLKVKTPLIEFIEWRKEEKFRRQQEKRRQREEEKQRRDEERKKRLEREKREALRKQKEKEKEVAKKNSSRPERAPRFEKKDEKKANERYENFERRKPEERYDKYEEKKPPRKDRYEGKHTDERYDKYEEKKYNEKRDENKSYEHPSGAKERPRNKYKEKPSMPIYQPAKNRKFADSEEKPLIFRDPDEN